jgi:hypothetical protein
VTPLQAVKVLLGIVDALDNHYFRDTEGIGDVQINEARQALAVLMHEHAPGTATGAYGAQSATRDANEELAQQILNQRNFEV